jgi:hypothetical protein
MVETTYADRLAIAMGAQAGERPPTAAIQALADHLRVSYTAVAKYWTDKSGAMTAENNSKAARFLNVDPDWLATGEGLMRTERIWPFGSEIAPDEYFALPLGATRPAIDVLLAALRRSASGGVAAAPSPAASRNRRLREALIEKQEPDPLAVRRAHKEALEAEAGGLKKNAEQKARARSTHATIKRKKGAFK